MLLAAGAAHAAGASADIELIRPTFSGGSLPGLDSPQVDETGTFRVGTLIQYQRDPLVLYEGDDTGGSTEIGAVVARRMALHVGANVDIGEVLSLRTVVPAGLQWRTEVPELSQDGPVFGDISLGGRVRVANTRRTQVGIGADVLFPSGTRQAWMGESRVRGQLGLTGAVRIAKRWDALGEVGLNVRPEVPTQQDFLLGPEFRYSLGARYHAWPDKVSLSAVWVARNGLQTTGLGGAENPSELLTVAQLRPNRDLQWDVGFGKGIAEGYGTSEFRAMVGVTWTRRPPPPEPPIRIVVAEAPDEEPVPVLIEVPDPPEPEWEEQELAKVKGEQIVIRDPIAFEFNTPNILPESLPTLQYVADLLNDNWQIAHLVIEGHASDEGSFVYNYDLSIRRSRAIWEQLLRSGVHPDRMSYRGMGEVVPKQTGGDEASLAANRRVEFKIVKQFEADERPPPYREDVRFPWDGEAATIRTPEAPPPPEEQPEADAPGDDDAPVDMEQFFDDIEAEMEDEAEEAAGPSPAAPPAEPPPSADQEPAP
jgi:outer membrane protein OmpA-like peptidoglycan-associated protein